MNMMPFVKPKVILQLDLRVCVFSNAFALFQRCAE